jgi:hypothetical protein
MNNIDDRINSIMYQLNDSGENYPHLSKLWKRYIELKVAFLNNSLYEVEKFLDKINDNDIGDIEPTSCALLYLLHKQTL